jgi:hypothetical protein
MEIIKETNQFQMSKKKEDNLALGICANARRRLTLSTLKQRGTKNTSKLGRKYFMDS